MILSKLNLLITTIILIGLSQLSHASGTMDEDEIKNVERVEINDDEARQRLSKTAGLLADYEIAAKKLINNLSTDSSVDISKQANALLELSENVINSAQYRLPQCNEYLAKTLMLKKKPAYNFS